jgi:hypothetical protein
MFALMMEAAHTSETSANSYFTRQYIPESKSAQCNVGDFSTDFFFLFSVTAYASVAKPSL